MKKKRKIKIPAAINGLEIAKQSSLVNGTAPGYNGIDPQKYASATSAMGAGGGSGFSTSGAMSQVSGAIDLLSAPFKKSTATTGKEAALQSVAAVGKGAAMGFTVGGPIGAIVGAGIGAIGSGGEKASMSSFTDYDEGTLGTGIIGAFGNKKLRREKNRIRQNAYNNKSAVQGTGYLSNEYAEDYGEMDVNTFEFGGQTPASLAYVDDGELIATPDGAVSKVPEQGQAVDSNIVNLPGGSRILSNTLKVPGTKKTFSELGEEMMTKRKSKGKDRFAQNSAKLNEMNNKMIHDSLFNVQEQMKQSKGIKDKQKAIGTESFAKGGTKIGDINLDGVLSSLASVAPIMSNLLTKNEAPVNTNYNPYASTISSAMRRRRFNIDPAVEDVTKNRAISRYNMSQMNTNTGANLAYGIQSAVNADKSIAALRSQQSNMDNQYMGEYANTLNNLGQQWVTATNLASDINAQNRAATRNVRRTGLSQMSQLAQNRELMNNQMSRDNAMMQLYAPFLQAGFSQTDLSNLKQYLRRGGNNVG